MMNFEAINTGCIDDKDTPWIPFAPYSPEVLVKYFKIDPVRGEIVLMMRTPAEMEMPRHHHTGTVIVYTVQGAWKYKEHDWVARAGSCVYETAGTRHTPEAVGEGENLMFVVLQGELVYLDNEDNVLAVENWRTSMDRYLAYCKENGLEARDLTAFEG